MSRKILGLSKRNWKCFIVGNIIGWAVALCALACRAGVPVEFTVETSRADVHEQPCYHGETLDFDVTFKSYGKDLILPTNAQANIFWQTNGMSAFFWRTNNVTVVSNKMYSTFTPAMDPGTGSCFGFLGIPGVNYRASFVLRFKNSPGSEPKVIEWPYRELDFNKIEMKNVPFVYATEVNLKTNSFERWEAIEGLLPNWITNRDNKVYGEWKRVRGAELENFVIQERLRSGYYSYRLTINGNLWGSETSETQATNITIQCNTNSAIWIECKRDLFVLNNLGLARWREWIEDSMDPRYMPSDPNKHNSALRIGPGTSASGGAQVVIGTDTKATANNAVAVGYNGEVSGFRGIAIGGFAKAGEDAVAIGNSPNATAKESIAIGTTSQASHLRSIIIGYDMDSSANDQVRIGRYNTADNTYFGSRTLRQWIENCAPSATETDPTVPAWAKNPTPPVTTETDPTVSSWAKAATKPTYSAAEVGAYPDSSGQMLSAQVATQGAHLNAEDAQCVVTNYDSVTHLREMKLRIKLQEGGTNVWREIWDEMDRWNAFTGTNFNWQSWIGIGAWIRNIEAALDLTSPKEYAFYDGVTGDVAPDGFFWISQPRIGICAGAGYQRYLDAGAAVWILESNGMCANVGGTTNGYFRISDEEGNVHFEIVKGDKETVPAISRSVTCTNVMGVTHWYSIYAVTNAISPPVAKFCRDLAAQTWVADTEASCPCNVVWTPGVNTYTLEFWPKASEPKMFCKAEYDKGGETKIRQTVPTEMQYIILNGTKYGLVPKTVNGELVMGLTTGGL